MINMKKTNTCKMEYFDQKLINEQDVLLFRDIERLMSNRLECVICLDKPIDPHTCQICMTILCKDCYTQSILEKNIHKCVLCNNLYSFVGNRVLKNIINNL